MPLYQDSARSEPAKCFIVISKDTKINNDSLRVAGNTLSLIDSNGQIIEEIVPMAKILPVNLKNEQINERTLMNSVEDYLAGKNATVLLIGSTYSGKERVFDGYKDEQPLAEHFLLKILPILRSRFNRYDVKVRAAVAIQQKIYDCLAEGKYVNIKLKETDWEGVELVSITSQAIVNTDDLTRVLTKAIRQKNKLVLEWKDLYVSYLDVTLTRQTNNQQPGNVISHFTFMEVPGVELLGDSQRLLKIKQSSLSTKSLLGFAAIIDQLNRNPESFPEYDSSIIGKLLKETLCGNSHLNVFFMLRSDDVLGCQATLRFASMMNSLQQYPIINEPVSFGLLRKYRSECLLRRQKEGRNALEDIHRVYNQMGKLQSEQDYTRIVQKYAELKAKYNAALKSKSEAQLELIRCEEEKLEIGKALVQTQIDNTKLLEKLQHKDAVNDKKILSTENKLAKRESSYQECLDRIQQLSESLESLGEAKRDLEVQFVALKRNYIALLKQVEGLREDNKNLSLDVINATNDYQRIKKTLGGKRQATDSPSPVQILQKEQLEQVRRQVKQQEELVRYLKEEIQRYKADLMEQQSRYRKSQVAGSGINNNIVELQNLNLQLQGKAKLQLRKIEQLQEKARHFQQQNDHLEAECKALRSKLAADTVEYRRKLEQMARGTTHQGIVKELRDNFSRRDANTVAQLNNSKKTEALQRSEIGKLKTYVGQLSALLREWGPKGVQIASLEKYQDLQTDGNEYAQLKIRNLKLEEELRHAKENPTLRGSRADQETSYLRGSEIQRDYEKLREEKNVLAEENRRLAMLMKDGNKMDLNIVRKENEQLRKEVEALRGQSSVSPSTNEQKLGYYQKHLKSLEKERSELLSRCVVAEQQVKNLLNKLKANTTK